MTPSGKAETVTANGLIAGHAYSITEVIDVSAICYNRNVGCIIIISRNSQSIIWILGATCMLEWRYAQHAYLSIHISSKCENFP